MSVKSCIKLLMIVLIFSFYTACKSYEIPYDRNLEGKTISTGLYVCEPPIPDVTYNAGVIIALAKAGLHSGDISKAYVDADIKEIFYEEFFKNGSTISPKINTSMKNPAEKELVAKQIVVTEQSDPKLSEFIFEGVPEKLGKDYIFIIKVLQYGMGEGSFSVYSRITYVASIINIKSNTKIWQMQSDKESSFPIELGYSTQKDVSKVRSNLRDCVAGIIKDVSVNLNNVK